MKRLFSLLNKRQLALIIGLVLLEATGFLLLPSLSSSVLNVAANHQGAADVTRLGIWMVIVTFTTIVIAILSVRFTARESQGVGNYLRKALFNHIMRFSQYELSTFGTSTLITRTTNDIIFIQYILMVCLRQIVLSPLVIVVSIIMAYQREAKLAWVFAIALPLILLGVGLILRKAAPIFRSIQTKTDRMNKVFREGLTGVRVIRAFNTTQYEADRFDETNRDYRDTAIGGYSIVSFMMPVMLLSIGLSNVLIFGQGSRLISLNQIEIGNLIAFVQYVFQILNSVLQVGFLLFGLPRAEAACERIFAVLDQPTMIHDPIAPQPYKTAGPLSLTFEQVEYGFQGAERPAIEGIDFTVKQGETLAIIGGTGSGKTTIANLIPRLYDVTRGAVRINGVDVREMTQQDLRAHIGFATQQAVLFSGTIRSNLQLGQPDATDEEMWRALEIAQGDFVHDLPEGLDARVEQGGRNYSGGQRQRISIARALIRRPDIYVFDDSFSALDFKTDANLRRALRPETADAITVIIAQRVNTVVDADRILVLDNGRLVGEGTHEELLATCAVYRDIYDSQTKGEGM